ncbi:helix-turn-helix transcriptional regulator [Brachybacterium hainanense]|uniref:Helix-turn-helix transcriptional regulator n=1 Tax=Brachybacterium hainanense TaxID=1541174 RepID=A0ABV6RBP4_9MICO
MVRLPLTPEDIARGARLGARLRRARGDRSILDVALEARVSPETLRKIETGRIATPAFSTIAALAQVLGLSLDALWAHAVAEDLTVPADDPDQSRARVLRSEPAAPSL